MASGQPGELTPIDTAISHLLPDLPRISDAEQIQAQQSQGRILAADIRAPINVPPWDNSAMDGYAVRAEDVVSTPVQLSITQRIAAGETGSALQAGTAARIFTGAPLPPNADAVVMQENTRAEESEVTILQAAIAGENLRRAGEDVCLDERLFEEGHRLRPQDLGVLASVGITELSVKRKPRVALMTTGDELVLPGTELKPGQIYNSNFYSLAALLENLDAEVLELGVIADDFDQTCEQLRAAAAEADCIISTGGVSVGEEDHVRAAVQSLGHLDLWKLAIKPGKPFASGKLGNTQFFGLPGNPVSAFVTFLLLVRPFLLTMLGCRKPFPDWLSVECGSDLAVSGERQEYMRVKLISGPDDQPCIEPFNNQSSGVGSSLSVADGLAVVPPHTAVAKGDKLKFLPFSQLMY